MMCLELVGIILFSAFIGGAISYIITSSRMYSEREFKEKKKEDARKGGKDVET